MPQDKSRRKFSKEFKKEAVKKVKDHDGDIDKVAGELDIHPLMLERWYDEAEGRIMKGTLVEDYEDTYWIRTKEDLLSSYMIHLWKNQYSNISNPFEPDPTDINVEQLRLDFLASTSGSFASGLYNEENPLFDLLPRFPQLGPMINELRQSKVVDLPEASRIYDKWNSIFRTKVKSEQETEEERIQNLSTDELCFTILENLNYKNIHLDDRDIETYTKYYIKMKELHFNEVREMKDDRKYIYHINKMSEWSRKYNLAAAEYQITRAKLRSKFMNDAFEVRNQLQDSFQEIYETMNNSGVQLLLLGHPIKNLILEMMVYLAKFENILEEENRLYEDRTEGGRPELFAERQLIFDLKDTIDRNGIKYSKESWHRNQSIWIADLLNTMSNFKRKEWDLCGWSEPFPFGSYDKRKIEKDLEKKRKK